MAASNDGRFSTALVIALLSAALAAGCSNGRSGKSRASLASQRGGGSGGTASGGSSSGSTAGAPEVETPPSYTVANSSRSIVSAAKTLAQRLPAFDSELEVAVSGEIGYRAALTSIMSDTVAFREAMLEEHRAYLGLGGSRPGSDVDFDEAARLGAYLVVNNVDYREIVTAKYCIDANYQKVPCAAFRDSPASVAQHGAGVLSSRAFLAMNKPNSPFNFKLVTMAFSKFACAVYPDSTDTQPTPAEVVSSSYAPWGLRNGRPSECYICHKAMNPKAYPFYWFNQNGFFTTNMDASTKRSNNEPSPVADVIVPGGDPIVKGRSVKTMGALGQIYADDPRFAGCMVKRYVNFMLGRPYSKPIPQGMEGLVTRFVESGYNVRELLTAISTTGIFVNRGGTQ